MQILLFLFVIFLPLLSIRNHGVKGEMECCRQFFDVFLYGLLLLIIFFSLFLILLLFLGMADTVTFHC